MAQLIMYWKNDGTASADLQLPEDVTVETFPSRSTAMEDWLDIVQYGLSEKREDESYYWKAMGMPQYQDKLCFFLVVNGQAAATITVVCNYETKEGLVHMVACKPEYRGRGLGHLLNDLAVRVLKQEGMQTGRLSTDDWRIPAIKSYLRHGFTPDLTTEEDYQDRWDKIYQIIGQH